MCETITISKKKLGAKTAYDKGYRVINNEVVFNGKVRKLYKHIKRADSCFKYC